MKVTCKFSGRLGNVLLEIINTFQLAWKLGVPEQNVVFKRGYDAFNGLKNWRISHPKDNNLLCNYLQLNHDILIPVWDHLLSDDDWLKIERSGEEIVTMSNGSSKEYIRNLPPGTLTRLFYDEQVFAKNREAFPTYWTGNPVALHVRRTDFAMYKNGEHLESSSNIQQVIDSHCGRMVVIFSDDPSWCKKELHAPVDGSIVVHEAHDPSCVDLITMSCFKEVIPNQSSSYSLFAQQLSKDLQQTGRMTW